MEEIKYLYKSPNYAGNLNNMRLSNKWCDITIKVDKKEYYAHKVILAANLKYFELMFSNDSYQESKEGVITMQCVEGVDLEAFIAYAYTGEIMLTNNNAMQILEFANYLGEEGIKEACVEFLTKHLKAEQACRAYSFANVIDSLSLKNKAKQMILLDFAKCSQTTDYLQLDQGDLMDIFSMGKTKPGALQQKFFEGIMKWIMQDSKERKKYMNQLLSCINLTKLKSENLLSYLYEIVTHNNDEDELIKDIILHYHTNKVQQLQLPVLTTNQVLMVIDRRSYGFEFQFYDFIKKKWTLLEKDPYLHESVGTGGATFANKLFFFTGYQNVQWNVFDPVAKRSKKLHTSINILSCSTVASNDKFLYLCGGMKADNYASNQVLRYDPLENSFKILPPMSVAKFNATTIVYQDCLFVLGGEVYNSSTPLINNVEKYDPNTNEWKTLPSMRESRAYHAVVAMDEKLYACGGLNKNSVEVYDLLKNSWEIVANMNHKRDCFLVIAHEGKLLAIGGDNDGTVEVYDPCKDQWQIDHEMSAGLQVQNPMGGFISSNCIGGVN